MTDNETIASILRDHGLDASAEEGWVYVNLDDGRTLCISAEYGASLSASLYPVGALQA